MGGVQPCRSQPPAARTVEDAATQLNSEPSEPTQKNAELLPPSLQAVVAARRTPQPAVVSEPAGPPHTALPYAGQAVWDQSAQCSTSTRRQSLDSLMSVGGAEPWQAMDAEADIVTVWDKYEEGFYGDYHPVASTFRR